MVLGEEVFLLLDNVESAWGISNHGSIHTTTGELAKDKKKPAQKIEEQIDGKKLSSLINSMILN